MYTFSENSRICFFGDSITFHGFWIRRIYEWYRNTLGIKCEMYNCGVPGNTAVQSAGLMEETVFIHNPTDVVIMFGMNDVGCGLYEADEADGDNICERRGRIDAGISAVKQIAEKLAARNIRMIFCTPTPYDELSDFKSAPRREGTQAALREFSSRVKHLAKKYGGHVVDMNAGMYEVMRRQYKSDQSVIGDDRVHPLPEGHELMAQIFLKAQGFDVQIDESCDKLKALAESKYDEWEEKRFKLEEVSLQNYFVYWCMYGSIKDKNTVRKIICDYPEEKQDDFLKSCFGLYLKTEHSMADDMAALVLHTKTVYGDV